MKKINLLKIVLFLFSSVILLGFTYKTDSTQYKCLIQMKNYTGEGAYIAISLLDEKGNYEKTLYVHGDDEDWYYDITKWLSLIHISEPTRR